MAAEVDEAREQDSRNPLAGSEDVEDRMTDTTQQQHDAATSLSNLGAAAAATAAATAVQGMNEADQKRFFEVLNTSVEPGVNRPGQLVTDIIWLIVISGLVLLILGSAFYIAMYLRDDREVDTLVTIFTTSLAFLGGLFAKSPVGANNG